MKKNYFIILFSIVIFLGCEKSDRDKDSTTNTSMDVAFTTNLVYDIFKTIHQAAYSSPGIVSSSTIDTNTVFNCDTITSDTLSNPKQLTIKFNTDCTSDGIIRNGYLYATMNGYYDNPGTKTTVYFNNFTYNGFTVFSGSMSYQYIGLTDSFPTYSISFNELKIVNKYNQKIFFSGYHQLQIIQGYSTPNTIDDMYSINGSNSGIALKGNGFSSQITTKLNLSGNCSWISLGIITVVPDNKSSRTLNFGSGCDNKIKVSIYENNYELELP